MSEKEQSSVLISLLLPYLQRANNPQVGPERKSLRMRLTGKSCGVPPLPDWMRPLPFQETELDILATVQNLLPGCQRPAAFLQPLSRLFSSIHHKLPRKALSSCFQVPERGKPLSLH